MPLVRRVTRVKTLLILLVAALVAGLPNAALATSSNAYQISVTGDHISVGISGSLFQNITTTSPFNLTIDHSNSTALTQDLNNSLRRLDSQVWVESPSLTASSNGTILTYSLNFSVLGAIHSYFGGSASADFAWRSFKVQEGVMSNGVAFNLVGKSEVGQSLVTLAKNSLLPNPSRIETVTFQMGRAQISPLQIEQLVPNLNLLDFSSLSASLDLWSGGFNTDSQMTAWTSHVGFDILAKISINEATGETVTTTEEAIYSVGATLTAPGFASPKGNLVYFGSNLLEPVFASVIIVAFAAWALTALANRRLTRSRRLGKRRK